MKPGKNKDNNEGFLEQIDTIIHEPARLYILLNLYAIESTDFVFLLKLTGFSDGNLSGHLKRLSSAGYVDMVKEFKNNKPKTTITLSEAGKDAIIKYSSFMVELLESVKSKTK
jgi:DNA-binding transcriptional ArsR family regulator